MAFVQQHPRQQRREREYAEERPSPSYAAARGDAAQDWSIVFPGRTRTEEAKPSTDPSDDDDEAEIMALTLPPLHDGTGRFTTYPNDPLSAGFASNQDTEQSTPPASEVFPESEFDGTEGDADEELGFGSGSDFESDAVASSVPSRSSARKVSEIARRRPSRLSQVDFASDQEGDSRTWSFLEPSQVRESTNASTLLFSSARSSHLATQQDPMPVVFTSDSEAEEALEADAYAADLASSNLAQSAGLAHFNSSRVRRPKRRHRLSAAGRSSKRSNTSQSVLSVDHHLLHASRSELVHDGAATPRSSASAAAAGPVANIRDPRSSKTSRVIGTLLRKVFDLEPEVLDSVFSDDPRYRSISSHSPRPRPGFSFEQSDALHTWGVETADDMMLDGRGQHERLDATPPLSTFFEEEEDVDDDHVAALLASSPLFDNQRPVRGEDAPQHLGAKLTEAALLQRRSSASHGGSQSSVMEPTTMEALSAFMNTVVMPVPMPFRLLGAIFGWSSIWSSSTASKAKRTDSLSTNYNLDDQDARKLAEEERKYRYERLLSAQQAKAWSRRYRGILFANVEEDEHTLDVPELWRGEEHPALAH